ncbi:MAG: cytochrome c oxidase subunit II [Chloroflexi bacterium]|nr:cytochrome c oxidase subunit II [Chloroflexota bacterium]
MVVHSLRIPWRLIILASLMLVTVLWSGCYPSNPQSTFDPAGRIAREQLTLFQIIFWTAAFVFVVVEGALIYAVFRFRKKAGQQPLPKQTHGNTPLEVTWTIIPALILVVIAVPTITTIFAQADAPEGEVVRVKAVAHQWWWEFNYPEVGVTTANELHIPINKPITLQLTSQDVIHSFWIPKLAGKTDMIPTRTNAMWFEAEEPGLFYGQCAEFCGTAHALMRFRVIAQSQAEFDAWVAAQQAPPAAPMAREFGLKGCTVCHTVNGPDAEGVQERRMDGFRQGQPQFPAPNLTHFATRDTLAAGLLERSDDNLRRWIQDPGEVKPGNRMGELAGAYHNANQSLSDADVAALVAYLQSLK